MIVLDRGIPTYVVPIIQEDMAKVDVVVGSCRSVDEYSTEHSVPGLNVEVRVVPTISVLNGPPTVSVGVTRSNRALGKARNAIHLVGVVLTDSVEVKTATIVLQRVCDMDHLFNISLGGLPAVSNYLPTVSPQSAMIVGPGKEPLIS